MTLTMFRENLDLLSKYMLDPNIKEDQLGKILAKIINSLVSKEIQQEAWYVDSFLNFGRSLNLFRSSELQEIIHNLIIKDISKDQNDCKKFIIS